MEVPLIAVTGGPCGGKTTFLAHAHQLLEEAGIYAVTLSETATELISAGLSPVTLGIEEFQVQVLLYSLAREERYRQAVLASPHAERAVILCDRGALDGAAYVEEETFERVLRSAGLTRDGLRTRYQMVVHLVSAANGAEEFYTLTNNTARSESPEEARLLDGRTQNAWLGHQHHAIIDNSTDFATKTRRALSALARTLNMPEPTEIERKFHVLNFDSSFVPSSAVAVEITQDYLVTKDEGEARVRRRNCNGELSFFYTEKRPTGRSGERIERERQITESEYLRFLSEKDPLLRTISKTRHCFPCNGKHFELDVFGDTLSGLVVLEVELQDIHDAVVIPPSWQVEEVTDNPAFKNRALAAT